MLYAIPIIIFTGLYLLASFSLYHCHQKIIALDKRLKDLEKENWDRKTEEQVNRLISKK